MKRKSINSISKKYKNKASSSESKRFELMSMLEKERADWNHDKDKLVNQIENQIECLSEQITQTCNTKDTVREREKRLKESASWQKTLMSSYASSIFASKMSNFDKMNTNKGKSLIEASHNGRKTSSTPRETKLISNIFESY